MNNNLNVFAEAADVLGRVTTIATDAEAIIKVLRESQAAILTAMDRCEQTDQQVNEKVGVAVAALETVVERATSSCESTADKLDIGQSKLGEIADSLQSHKDDLEKKFDEQLYGVRQDIHQLVTAVTSLQTQLMSLTDSTTRASDSIQQKQAAVEVSLNRTTKRLTTIGWLAMIISVVVLGVWQGSAIVGWFSKN